METQAKATTNVLKTLFAEQRMQINGFFSQLRIAEVERMLEAILDCSGMLFFCGVGKSGIIAEKLAVTMVSTGTRSLFVPPTNALHGDLGIVQQGDLFIMLSKSGESDELLDLIPFVRNKGAIPIAWTSSRGSRLERACELAVHIPVGRELCPFNLSPTTSTAVQLIFGDVLAVAVMKSKKFSLVEYAQNHPAGRIGKRITVRVCDLMVVGDGLPLVTCKAVLRDCLVELSNKRCGCLLVVDTDRKLRGIFTDGDLRRALEVEGPASLGRSLDELMVRTFRSVEPDMLAWEAMQTMEADSRAPITVLPVLHDGGRVMGLLRMHDVLQAGIR